MKAPEFELIPLAELVEHEQIEPDAVQALIRQIRSDGYLRDPIWVARGSGVILNGHHRYHALVALGAARAPAWVLDYDDPSVELERWNPGPAVTKASVVERARSGVPFPPKTTKHVLRVELPVRITPLSDLLRDPSAGSPPRPALTRVPIAPGPWDRVAAASRRRSDGSSLRGTGRLRLPMPARNYRMLLNQGSTESLHRSVRLNWASDRRRAAAVFLQPGSDTA